MIDLPVAPTDVWDRRFAAVDPAGRVLLYATPNGGQRFALDDGRPLGRVPITAVAHAADDGRLVAGVDPGDGSVGVYDVATGGRVAAVPGHRSATAVCLSADDATVAVADGQHLRTYAVPGGQRVSTVDTPLLPLAVPAAGGDRFVAFDPDAQGEGGNLVVADRADGRVAAVLVRAGGPSARPRLPPTGGPWPSSPTGGTPTCTGPARPSRWPRCWPRPWCPRPGRRPPPPSPCRSGRWPRRPPAGGRPRRPGRG